MMGKLKAETKKTHRKTPVFDGKNHGFRLDVPLDQSIDLWKKNIVAMQWLARLGGSGSEPGVSIFPIYSLVNGEPRSYF